MKSGGDDGSYVVHGDKEGVNSESNDTHDDQCRELVVANDEEESCLMGNGGIRNKVRRPARPLR